VRAIAAELWRGGTSRGLVLEEDALLMVGIEPQDLLSAALGSPDPLGRQVDGVGGGASSLSKAAIVRPSDSPAHDVDFTFAQVDVVTGAVEFVGNCGNFVAAIGPYAVDHGWLAASSDPVTVRIHCTNTGASVIASFHVADGRFDAEGEFAIDGVPGTGSEILLAWPQATTSEQQFPLGTDELRARGSRSLFFVDVGNPLVVVDGPSFGFAGADEFDRVQSSVLAELEPVRRRIGAIAGVAPTEAAVPLATPKVAVVWPSASTQTVTVRAISMGAVHRTVPLTVAMGLAAWRAGYAARTGEITIVIEHPAGSVAVGVVVEEDGTRWRLASLTTSRTARCLMRGEVLVPLPRAS
jgi:2-methylaconitate isomerase